MQAVTMMQQQSSSGRYRAPAAFRMYLMDGEHWRVGKRLRSEERTQGYTGLQLHRQGSGTDGQTGPMQLATGFLDHLEQAWVAQVIEHNLPAERWRYGKVQSALDAVREDRPDEAAALDYYLVPEGRRSHSVTLKAIDMGVTGDTLRDMAKRACELVWGEMGECW